MRKGESFIAWAVNTRSKENHGFLGRYWQFCNSSRVIPPHLEGCLTALFETRELAREAVKGIMSEEYNPWPHARAQKVEVTIKEVE